MVVFVNEYKNIVCKFVRPYDADISIEEYLNVYEDHALELLDHFLEMDLFVLGLFLKQTVTRDDLMISWIDYVLWIEIEGRRACNTNTKEF